MRSAPQFHKFSSKIVSSKLVKFQTRSEGCRVGPCRSVADSLFRPHPEQRPRASREPKDGESCPAVCVPLHHKVHKVHSRRWRNCTVCAFAPPPDDSEAVVRSLRTVSEAGRATSDASGRVRTRPESQNGHKIVNFQIRSAPQFPQC